MINKVLNSISLHYLKIEDQFNILSSFTYLTDEYLELIQNIQRYFETKYKQFLTIVGNLKEGDSKKNVLFFINNEDYESNVGIFLNLSKAINILIYNFRNVKTIEFHQVNFILIRRIIGENSKFIILPEQSLNYAYSNTPKLFKELYDDEIGFYTLFKIPFFNNNEILNNSTLAHELGHYLEEKNNIWNKISDNEIMLEFQKNNMFQRIEEEVNKHNANNPLSTMQKMLFRTVSQTNLASKLKQWGKELICDIIGLKLFGLPFFFSFVEIMFLTDPKSSGDEEHPPYWLRLKYMFLEINTNIKNNLKKMNSVSREGESKKIGQKILEELIYIENNLTIRVDQKNYIEELILNLFDSPDYSDIVIDEINKLVNEGKIQVYSYDNSENFKNILSLIDLLDEYITPNELIIENNDTKPADIITILNAGWFYYLFKRENHFRLFDEMENPKEQAKILQKLNFLILKAIELSNIHKFAKENLKIEKNDNK